MAILALGSYIQTHTGFAFGLIVIGLSGALNLMPIPLLALLVSGLSLGNSTTALYGNQQHIHRSLLSWSMLGCLPGVVAGVWLLDFMSSEYQNALQLLLGVCILVCGVLMAYQPSAGEQPSPPGVLVAGGALSGIMGGLFATFGPALAFVLYRQPLPLKYIVNSLLAFFWIAAIVRLLIVEFSSGIPTVFFLLTALGLPWIYLCTMLSKRLPPPISETALRRTAFALLTLAGISVIASGLS